MSATVEAVRERPILFSGPMVRAILDGRKTQTRRVVTRGTSFGNHPPEDYALSSAWVDPGPSPAGNPGPYLKANLLRWRDGTSAEEEQIIDRIYPRWWPDDLLWVRETWAPVSPDEMRRPICECNVEYRADTPNATRAGSWDEAPSDAEAIRWRPSIHMPRWASRLTLHLTDVRAERVQDISEADAEAEGLTKRGEWWDVGAYWTGDGLDTTASGAFRMRWNALNAKRGYGWDENPWVWAISFERVATQPGGAA